MEDSDWKIDPEAKVPTLIDCKSAADDHPSELHSSETFSVPRGLGMAVSDSEEPDGIVYDSVKGAEIAPIPETLEPEITRKIRKCNLRKSLAWDNAFFTSAGVLDPDELSSMIEDAGQGRNVLPPIEEDVRISSDSTSTLGSDNGSLGTIEAELFKDIRASIQKSSKTPCSTNLSGHPTPGNTESRPKCSLKKSALDCQNRVKSNSALKQAVTTQAQREAKKVVGSPQIRQSVVGSGRSSSSFPKPTKQVSRFNSVPSVMCRSTSLSTTRVKTENSCGKVVGKASQISKAAGLGGPRKVVPKPVLSSRSSSIGSSPASRVPSTKFSSSLDNSGSSLTDKGKSPSISGRRRNDSKTSGSSSISSYLVSPKICTSVSPASSISDRSSESSSSTVNQRSDRSRASLGTSSCKSFESDGSIPASNARIHTVECISGHEGKVARLPAQTTLVASNRALSGPTSAKPSGLRLPSPKIGFFDGVKPVISNLKGSLNAQSTVPTSLPKFRPGSSSPSGNSHKANIRKILPARKAMESGNVKSGYMKSMGIGPEGADNAKSLTRPSAKTVVQCGISDLTLNDCSDSEISPNVEGENLTDGILVENDLHPLNKTNSSCHSETHGDQNCIDMRSMISSIDAQEKPFIFQQMVVSSNNVIDSSISTLSMSFDASTIRTPFAEKNIICEDGGFERLKESSAQAMEKIITNLSDLEIGSKG